MTNQHALRSDSFDEYCHAIEHVKPLGMDLKQLRTVETIVLNTIVGGVALAAIGSGAEPTLVGLTALIGLGLLNGIKVSEWAAAAQWLAEARAAAAEDTPNAERPTGRGESPHADRDDVQGDRDRDRDRDESDADVDLEPDGASAGGPPE